MINTNFMLSDLTGTLIGFLIFPLVIVVPGYLAGWTFDLFSFRSRLFVSRLGISLLLSVAICPILYYLLISWFSLSLALVITMVFTAIFVYLLIGQRTSFLLITVQWRSILLVALFWVALALFLLIDLQPNSHELYFNVVSFDHTTRVSIIDAMTRTGVPPINPSYYPGHYEKLTFLYFFWYIIASLVDALGGSLVDARMALFASIIWCGLALMAAVVFYLRLRNGRSEGRIWKQAQIGLGSLLITGLDIFPALLLMGYGNSAFGDLEQWNEQITAWLGSLLWVPHHIASFIAGFVGVALLHSVRDLHRKQKIISMLFAGVAFASAIGLSVWVTLVFVIFWGLWMLLIFFQKADRELLFPMLLAGLFAVILSSTFLLGLISSGTGASSGGALPIAFTIRAFHFADAFTENSSLWTVQIVRLLLLPLNYFFELGFFFLVGLIWIKRKRHEIYNNQFYLAETLLLAVSFFLATFMRSTIIDNNDLGWRTWIPGQFILLIWGVDILPELARSATNNFRLSTRMKYSLALLVALGVSTTLMDAALLRFGYYLSYGQDAGRKIYSGRSAYTRINESLLSKIIVQNNPLNGVDQAIGLYGMHQSTISARTAYGVPALEYQKLVDGVGRIFTTTNIQEWDEIDSLCNSYSINELVITNSDPLWEALPVLARMRIPTYMDEYYAAFPCGAD